MLVCTIRKHPFQDSCQKFPHFHRFGRVIQNPLFQSNSFFFRISRPVQAPSKKVLQRLFVSDCTSLQTSTSHPSTGKQGSIGRSKKVSKREREEDIPSSSSFRQVVLPGRPRNCSGLGPSGSGWSARSCGSPG